ncbi:pentapeptide repeat-containing protein [Hydrogenophaga sp. BPS33]|uniref:pentapeptide repeat-containing protein n=1 Tax=Hydrogenophaga sp. BPS33 TaxID=2651974 RepID=UPI00131F49C9|nr:pentapeptide repeat-containing protein [Hydrogenophaga sp. BPS33]QHE85461.1 pentapeptide repeat-containing protein [Hydrogenophaga sp. BPS33]
MTTPTDLPHTDTSSPALETHEDLSFNRHEMAFLAQSETPQRFERCDFDCVDLSGLTLRSFQFIHGSFMDASFQAASMAHTQWIGCRGRRAKLESADLSDATFNDCDLIDTRWRHANLASTLFKACMLEGARFLEVISAGLTFEDTLLAGADLREADLGHVMLDEAPQLRGSTISRSQAALSLMDVGIAIA